MTQKIYNFEYLINIKKSNRNLIKIHNFKRIWNLIMLVYKNINTINSHIINGSNVPKD